MIHIGKLIEEEMRLQERTPAWLAKKINCERPNVYYIFRQKSINTDLLLRISHALNHNFFLYYIKEYEEGEE
ncbi:MAG: XRE family transcriptional regulator [Bacteroidales bacterium]|nr:XRE family transcriptional regulator [Bacteroidales bacterium]